MAIASVALWIILPILTVISFGILSILWFLAYVPWIAGIVFSIIAFLKVKDAIPYRYPVTFRFIK